MARWEEEFVGLLLVRVESLTWVGFMPIDHGWKCCTSLSTWPTPRAELHVSAAYMEEATQQVRGPRAPKSQTGYHSYQVCSGL